MPDYLAWRVLAALAVFGAIRIGRISLDSPWHNRLRWGLVALLLFNEISWTIYRSVFAGIPIVGNLPLHLCDLAVIALLAALISHKSRLVEFAYYAGAVSGLLALASPAISEIGGIRPIAEARYFLTHIALLGGGFYVTFGRRFRPEGRAVLRTWTAIHLYALLVTPLNLALGTNYFYTLAAPSSLGWLQSYPHWLFLAAASLIFAVAFLLLHLPFDSRRSEDA